MTDVSLENLTIDTIIDDNVAQYFKDNIDDIKLNRYRGVPKLIQAIKALPALKDAHPKKIKDTVDKYVLETLGPKDERDLTKQPKQKQAKTPAKQSIANEPASVSSIFTKGFLGALHKPGENPQINDELRKEHLAATGGKVFTRFPPEPNGYLHIGHAKAILINFGYAKFHDGHCYLRFDDTNPEAEKEEFFTSIKDLVAWLGFQPYKVTHSSDHFDELYALAEKLILKDGAYVCSCTPEQILLNRGGPDHKGPRVACPCRSASIEKNLEDFRGMRDGKFAKGSVTLRMKQDLEDPNPQMWDLVAYRILDAPHHLTGDKWRIYPTYDFTHCLCDSFENITHSLCTTEFQLSRQSYEWLCDAVEVYKPAQREYGRLNLTGTVLSKRKIAKLVHTGTVRGWDDPRLYTLVAIRRRGVPPGAILSFVAELGVTTAVTSIQEIRFEASVRRYLENTVPRLSMILDPVLMIIDNLPDDYCEELPIPFKPGTPEMGEHNLVFTNRVYIDRSDFREEDSPDYFRFAPGKSVGLLKVPFNVRVTSFNKDPETGLVTEIHAHYENDTPHKKPKTYVQWIGESKKHGSPVKLDEVRIFSPLFNHDNPATLKENELLDAINPNSEQVIKTAIIDTGFHHVRKNSPWQLPGGDSIGAGGHEEGAPYAVRFQAMRVGYFVMDTESDPEHGKIILNRIVSLKETVAAKNA
ncbi:hypothetical protein CANCADRAFT_142693 [Tortispora caseinolytica NRRL Y-17796]|uniref:glutamine--tRNA ligase n=1 Tax=Tortispora caseinolytica NRRL Y-17796 TaxID=767744 RepID=A0A1E4TD92_9ASCO|nr:hypothetical protein CANCADRAFT_142693 [Tortispora caseinolytica NRRL Y-17796]